MKINHVGVAPTKTRISIILDESGSMMGLEDKVVAGLNELIQTQRAIPGKTRWTLTKFDNGEVNVLFENVRGRDVRVISREDYNPRGGTNLYDAIGYEVGRLLETDDGSPTIVAINTDGYENISKEFGKDDVQKLFAKCEKKGWQLIFMGANQDALLSAGGMGLRGTTVTWDSNTVQSSYVSLSNSMAAYRGSNTASVSNEDLTS